MEIRVDGNRSSSENWMRAEITPLQELPVLNPEQRATAASLGLNDEDYARNLLASNLERKDLEIKAQQAAHVIERLGLRKVPTLRVDSVWLKTLDGKFRFDVEAAGSHSLIFVSEDLMNDLLESGSRIAEESIARIVDYSLPANWTASPS